MFDELTVTKKFRQSEQNKTKQENEKKRKSPHNYSTTNEMIYNDDDIDVGWFWLEKPTEIDKNQFAAVAKFENSSKYFILARKKNHRELNWKVIAGKIQHWNPRIICINAAAATAADAVLNSLFELIRIKKTEKLRKRIKEMWNDHGITSIFLEHAQKK